MIRRRIQPVISFFVRHNNIPPKYRFFYIHAWQAVIPIFFDGMAFLPIDPTRIDVLIQTFIRYLQVYISVLIDRYFTVMNDI